MSADDASVTAEPRRPMLWATITCALATLALAWPALGGGFLVNPRSDQFIAGYAFREFAAASLKAGEGFPLWNPYLFGGMPYVAAMHGDIFYPTFLLRMILPTDVAMTWGFIIHLFLCGLFTFMFLRRVGIGFAASLIGALSYMLSGQIASLVSPGHDGKLFINALFPLTLYLLHQGIRGGRQWAWGLLAITIGLAVLSPHPQLLQYLLLASGVYALHLAYFGPKELRLDRRVATTRLAFALGAVMLGGAMGAIQYLPVREYVSWSPRAEGMMVGAARYEHAVSYSMPPMELINTIVPQFTGILDRYWGMNGIHFHSEYLGIIPLILAGAAFGTAGIRRRRAVWLWTGILFISVLWALGGNTGFYRLVYALVPGTKYFRAPSTIFFISAFAVAVLAALGAERLLAREVSRRYLLGWAIALGLLALVGVAGGLTNMAETLAPGERYERVLANDPSLRMGAIRTAVFGFGALAALWAIGIGRIPVVRGGWLLSALVVADLWSIDRYYWQFSQPAAVVYGTDAVVDYLKARTTEGRVMPIPIETYRDPFLTGDALMSHRIRSAQGYHGNELGRYRMLSNQIFQSLNVWRLSNIQWVLTDSPQSPIPAARLVAGPARNAHGTMVYLFEVPEKNPPAWVAPAIVKAPDDQVFPTLLDPRFNLRTVALFDTAASVQGVQLQSIPAPLALTARVTKHEPGEIDITLDGPAPAGSALVMSENYFPGWTASVDGKPATVSRADFVLMGVPLPAGARNIQLRFDSAPVHTGKIVTLLALGTATLLLVAGVLAARRGTASA